MRRLELLEDSIIVADVHYGSYRRDFLEFLQEININKTHQLILLGDIFDFLSAYSKRSCEVSKELICELNRLSKEIQIVYIEGNHDFKIGPLFRDMEIIERRKQPFVMNFGNQKVAFAHGDGGANIGHKIYISFIANRATLMILDFLDRWVLKNFIVDSVYKRLEKKILKCKEFDFGVIAKKRVKRLKVKTDYLIEGHFHQNMNIKENNICYIATPSFACNQSFFIVKSSRDGELSLDLRSFV